MKWNPEILVNSKKMSPVTCLQVTSLKIEHRHTKLKGEGYVKKLLLGSKRMQVRLINWLHKKKPT